MGATIVAPPRVRPRLRTALTHPHTALAAGAAVAVFGEWGYRSAPSDAWLALEALAAGAALAYAWREQRRLRLGAILAIALAFHASWLGLHFGLGVEADVDSSRVYRWQGNAILNGYYPRSEYPVGAVLLFTLEAFLGGGPTKVANALLMIPFQLGLVAAIWSVRSRCAPWLAVVVAFWPLNAFYWEFKFDLVPAALLAAGLVLALRERWGLAGLALGLGAAVKWTPGLAFVGLLVWLIASRRRRDLVRHAGAFVAAVVAVNLPFLIWNASAVAHAYTRQSGRTITPESLWYLVLRPFGLARLQTHVALSAGAPAWADAAAAVVQAAALVALLVVLARLRTRVAAVAVAAMLPIVFLVTNRIFSPQFVLVLFAGWAIAGALLLRTRREQLAFGCAMATASCANAFVYPYALPFYPYTWPAASALLFGLSLAICGWVVSRAFQVDRPPAAAGGAT